MKNQWIVIGLLVACFLCCKAPLTTEAESALQVMRSFHAAFDAKDIPAMTSLCDEQMFWYTLDGRALARNDLAGFFSPMFARWNKIQTTVTEVQAIKSGRLCVLRYRSTIAIETPHNQSQLKSIHTMALIERDSTWKIWQHQMSIQ